MKIVKTYSDGGARGNPGPAAIGVVLCDAEDGVVYEEARCIGETTNNRAEYNAMILALTLAKERGATELTCYADSELIVYQLQGVYRIKDAAMRALSEKVQSLASGFSKITYRQVPREHPMISRADKILNQALDKGGRGTPARRPGSSSQPDLF